MLNSPRLDVFNFSIIFNLICKLLLKHIHVYIYSSVTMGRVCACDAECANPIFQHRAWRAVAGAGRAFPTLSRRFSEKTYPRRDDRARQLDSHRKAIVITRHLAISSSLQWSSVPFRADDSVVRGSEVLLLLLLLTFLWCWVTMVLWGLLWRLDDAGIRRPGLPWCCRDGSVSSLCGHVTYIMLCYVRNHRWKSSENHREA